MVRRGNESKSMEKCRQMAYNERNYRENVGHGVVDRGTENKSMRKSRKAAIKNMGSRKADEEMKAKTWENAG